MARRDAPADGVPIGRCAKCNKLSYTTRSAARKSNSRHRHGGAPMSVYRCPHQEGYWHLGHVPREVRQGMLAKEDYEERTRRKKL